MNKKDTRLLPYIVQYENVLKTFALTDEENDYKLAEIMTGMERQFNIPLLMDETFNECIELYRTISYSRVTHGDMGIFQIGNKIKILDGNEFRGAKAFSVKNTGSSQWYLCIDQTGSFGYALEKSSIEWNGKEFIYDCKKWDTPLSMITDQMD